MGVLESAPGFPEHARECLSSWARNKRIEQAWGWRAKGGQRKLLCLMVPGVLLIDMLGSSGQELIREDRPGSPEPCLPCRGQLSPTITFKPALWSYEERIQIHPGQPGPAMNMVDPKHKTAEAAPLLSGGRAVSSFHSRGPSLFVSREPVFFFWLWNLRTPETSPCLKHPFRLPEMTPTI